MSVGLTTGLLLLHTVTKRADISLPLTCSHSWIIDVLLFYLAHEFLKKIKLPVHVKQYDVLGIYTRLVSFFFGEFKWWIKALFHLKWVILIFYDKR